MSAGFLRRAGGSRPSGQSGDLRNSVVAVVLVSVGRGLFQGSILMWGSTGYGKRRAAERLCDGMRSAVVRVRVACIRDIVWLSWIILPLQWM